MERGVDPVPQGAGKGTGSPRCWVFLPLTPHSHTQPEEAGIIHSYGAPVLGIRS